MIAIIRSGLFTVAVMTLTVPAAAGANQADASEIALQWSVFEACGENMACRSAVELQFASCLEKSPYQAFLDAESEEQESLYLALTMQALAACIVDENGEPFFKTPDSNDTDPSFPGDDDES